MKLIILGLVAIACEGSKQQRRFPDDFLFGAATSAYQVEGAWNADDKSINIWDQLTNTKPHAIKDRSNGKTAANSFNNYKRDVEMMRELGLDAYRFSISWTRMLPNGFSNKISTAGVNYYNNLINEMLMYNIMPIATIYHWDLPQILQGLGGFMNPILADWFEDYARVVFTHFGDRVKHWITINEPREICYEGYDSDSKAPMLNASGIGAYYCAKTLVLAHARAYHVYDKEFRPHQGGICGITFNLNWFAPHTDTEEDHYAAEIRRQADCGIYTEPIFSKEGGFPKDLSEIVAKKSLEQGYVESRMPDFTDEEREFVRGSSDFFGINIYTTFFISATKFRSQNPIPSIYDDAKFGHHINPDLLKSASAWLVKAPDTILNSLIYIQKKYNNPTMYITENGWSTAPGASLLDDDRVDFLRDSLNSVLDAIDAGVNIKGYMAWSLMDNFEWTAGYSERFGLYEVDFSSPSRTRTPRKSAFVYKEIIRTRVVDPKYEPQNYTMQIDVS